MKYLVIISSGLTDKPIAEKDNRTPLQLADTPHLDNMVRSGHYGSVRTIPEDLHPGSDVSFLSLLGYDPKRYYAGPANFEAEALGVELKNGEVPLCCDFVNLQSSHNDMVMKDFTAGHLSSKDSRILLEALQEQITDSPVRFYPGAGYKNLMVIESRQFPSRLNPPNEMIGEGIRQFMPEGEEFKELVYIMNQAQIILHNHPYNQERKKQGKDPVNSVWLWGNGAPTHPLPPFAEKFHKRGSVVSASLLLKGLGKSAGLSSVSVDQATGFSDTNYRGKVDAAVKELETKDVVYLHIGAAEEVSLKGNIDDKILTIEDFDREVVGVVLSALDEREDVKLLIVEGHVTSAISMRYSTDEVPFLVFPSSNGKGKLEHFDEQILDAGTDRFKNGPDLMEAFFKDRL